MVSNYEGLVVGLQITHAEKNCRKSQENIRVLHVQLTATVMSWVTYKKSFKSLQLRCKLKLAKISQVIKKRQTPISLCNILTCYPIQWYLFKKKNESIIGVY